MITRSLARRTLLVVLLGMSLTLSTLLTALPAAADKIDPGMPFDQRETIEQPTEEIEPPDPGSQGPECRAADCHPPQEGKCDPSSKACPPGGSDSPKRDLHGNGNDPPGPLSTWNLRLYLDPRDVFGNPYWIDPSSDPTGRYPVQVTIDDGITTTTLTVWCNSGAAPGWCDLIGPYSHPPKSVIIDSPGLLASHWMVVSGPGTYSHTDLVACGNPCEIPIVLQIKDLFIYLEKFWYGPEPPGSSATYTIDTGLGTFTITCPGTASREDCTPYPLVIENWALADPSDRWIAVQETGLPADWEAVEQFGLGFWDGSEPPRSGYGYSDFGPQGDWWLQGGSLYIETLNLNTADPQPPAGETLILEFRKAWVGGSPPNSPATIQLTFYPEGHWLHQVRTFTCPGTAAVETCYQINFPFSGDEDDFFANFTMTITELSGPPGWTPTDNFGTYDAIGLFELLGCTPDDCPDIPPACYVPDKEGPPILTCTITLTNQALSGGGGGGSGDEGGGGSGGQGGGSGGGGGSGDEGGGGSGGQGGGQSGGNGSGTGAGSGSGQWGHGNATADDPGIRGNQQHSDDSATWFSGDTEFAQNAAHQVLPRTGYTARPVAWLLLSLLAIVPAATGVIASRVTRRPS